MSIRATQIRLQEETYEKLSIISNKELRSLNSQMEYFLIKEIEKYEKEHGEINVDYLHANDPEVEY